MDQIKFNDDEINKILDVARSLVYATCISKLGPEVDLRDATLSVKTDEKHVTVSIYNADHTKGDSYQMTHSYIQGK